jgi:hypothetical protein
LFGTWPRIEVKNSLTQPNEWFLLEVLADGNRLIIKVNSQTTVDYVDLKSLHTEGHFALQQFGAATVVHFRKIEIKELAPSKTTEPSTPFVVLARDAGAERKFGTLAEAVTAAQSGDTIEIRGNGPFVSDPIILGKKALVVRAAKGFRPVIELNPARGQGAIPSLDTSAPLVLEGLELRRIEEERYKGGPVPLMVRARGAPVRAAHCRFVAFPDRVAVTAHESPLCELRNCEFLSAGQFACVDHLLPRGGRLILANNVMLGGDLGAAFHHRPPDLADVAIELTRNTWVVQIPMGLFLDALPAPRAPGTEAPPKPIQLTASGNLLDGHRRVMEVFQSAELLSRAGPLDASNTQALLGRLVNWREQNNVYPEVVGLLGYYVAGTGMPQALPAGKSLADWNRFWDVKDTAAVRGEIRYRGGDLRSRSLTQLEQATAEDFRLADGSAGKGAGPGSKDLGADVDLVGAGAAYERWKKMPEYQEWLKRTGQLTPVAVTHPFVILARDAGAERKFATLAEAVAAVPSGGTIEIRDNGPFVTEAIRLEMPLTIRAGEGFRPVLRLSAADVAKGKPLIENVAPLVLEGLELQRLNARPGGRRASSWSSSFGRERPLFMPPTVASPCPGMGTDSTAWNASRS